MISIARRLPSISTILLLALALIITLPLSPKPGLRAEPPSRPKDLQIGQSFQVPYRLTDTNHFLVRARVNGKGPFNFLVDSGAPAFFIATATAKKIGLTPAMDDFWTSVDRLDLEGGSRLTGIKARIEDPFQLVGMNALGLPGASIDGILGFTILARFRLEIDLTKDRMVWTRLDYDPRDPPVPKLKPGEQRGAPAGVQAMSALGPLAKGLAFLMGKQPEELRKPRGFLGLEWSEDSGRERKYVQVKGTLEGSPAARGGIVTDDQILRINDRIIESLKDARAALAGMHPGDSVRLVIRRGSGTDAHELTLTLTAAEGL